MMVSTLPLILCTFCKTTTTSCSKVPQGLCFPLGVSGLCTRRYFQKALIRDSNNLVKPFMQVVIHTTRYYAHAVTFYKLSLEKKTHILTIIYYGGLTRVSLCMSPHRSDYIFMIDIYVQKQFYLDTVLPPQCYNKKLF